MLFYSDTNNRFTYTVQIFRLIVVEAVESWHGDSNAFQDGESLPVNSH